MAAVHPIDDEAQISQEISVHDSPNIQDLEHFKPRRPSQADSDENNMRLEESLAETPRALFRFETNVSEEVYRSRTARLEGVETTDSHNSSHNEMNNHSHKSNNNDSNGDIRCEASASEAAFGSPEFVLKDSGSLVTEAAAEVPTMSNLQAMATTSVRRSDSSARLGRQTTDDILARAVSGSHQSEMTRVDSYVLHPVRPARRSMSSMVRGSNVVVHCYVKIYYLTNVDTRNSNFECDFLVALDWYLPEMQAWQENFPGETPNWHDFFHPHMEIDNVHTNGDFVEVGGTQTPRLDGRKNAGWCKLTQRFRGPLQTYFSVRDFPFDQHMLQIVVKIRTGNSKARCSITHPSAILRDAKHDINNSADYLPDWKVVRWFGAEDLHRKDTYNFGVHVQRHVAYIGWNIMFIFFLLEVLVFTAYGVQRDNIGDRMAINLTLVLTAVAFKYVVKEEIPNVPYLTILDKYILIGFFMMCVQGMENLYVGGILSVQAFDDDKGKFADELSIAVGIGVLFLKNLWVLLKYMKDSRPFSYEELQGRQNVHDMEYKGAVQVVPGECINRVLEKDGEGDVAQSQTVSGHSNTLDTGPDAGGSSVGRSRTVRKKRTSAINRIWQVVTFGCRPGNKKNVGSARDLDSINSRRTLSERTNSAPLS
mmetsp:Transcript_7568/g.14266  ORF Transcript_7568/g.14266 Transcript_7568/m.14266 type:complete len:650 (+) Transcript_7568:457-2406(+)|eukprot:CAMPEP_0114248436 /NCGR_PEP_ID=MMETSP0058-20121206/13576_1 /TAXON_ID=36894 /ORGANISM="Pyramimonas parkeae, CCMP726" /LENGTH=649 /DNA_ID=CAMNT_0001361851 /DNA_START=347 /DNA_END=2296 /DNA_ORIENTATION=+